MKRNHSALIGIVLAIASVRQADGRQNTAPQTKGQAVSTAEPVGRADDEKSIRAGIQAFSLAFQKNDARTLQGHAALLDHYASRFAGMPDHKLETVIDAIKFLAPGIARETGHTRVLSADGATVSTGRYAAIHINRHGRWLIASVREIADKDISHYERLKELEWLVGDWVAETEEAVVFTSVAWTDEKNFLLRSFDVRVKGKPALTGTQRIGWDPLTKQIKSWVFDSRGGYGEGLWTRSSEQWVVKATGVRPDGRTASATQVLTYVNRDKLRWKSIDRTLGDEIVPEIEEIVMVRKPPQPK
jgi:hypothetical protein